MRWSNIALHILQFRIYERQIFLHLITRFDSIDDQFAFNDVIYDFPKPRGNGVGEEKSAQSSKSLQSSSTINPSFFIFSWQHVHGGGDAS